MILSECSPFPKYETQLKKLLEILGLNNVLVTMSSSLCVICR